MGGSLDTIEIKCIVCMNEELQIFFLFPFYHLKLIIFLHAGLHITAVKRNCVIICLLVYTFQDLTKPGKLASILIT